MLTADCQHFKTIHSLSCMYSLVVDTCTLLYFLSPLMRRTFFFFFVCNAFAVKEDLEMSGCELVQKYQRNNLEHLTCNAAIV